MKLIILDRDGVINQDSADYIKSPAEWQAFPESLQAIARLNQAGYTVSVATNQSGIGRGYYTRETLATIHQKMQDELAEYGGRIDSIFYCPHHPNDGCNCRKPKPGLLEKISHYYDDINLAKVPMVGDKQSDNLAAIAAGAQPIRIAGPHCQDCLTHVPIYPSLAAYVDALL